MVRELRKAGAIVNSFCGICVHMDEARRTAATLRNLVNIMESKEDLLYKALDVQASRERYCQKADVSFRTISCMVSMSWYWQMGDTSSTAYRWFVWLAGDSTRMEESLTTFH